MARKCVPPSLPLPGIPRRPGRPPSPTALTGAQRQAKFRKKAIVVDTGDSIKATVKRLAESFDLPVSHVTRELLRFALCNRIWDQTGFPSRVTKNQESA